MSTPFRDLHNNSNASASSYETAWSSSFSARLSINDSRLKDIKNEPFSENDDDISNLENNISMMSVSSPAPKTPARKAAGANGVTPMTPGDQLLQSVQKEQDRQLLRKMYPEMFQDSPKPPRKPKNVAKQVKDEPLSSDGENDKENTPPGFLVLEEVKQEKKSLREQPKELPKEKKEQPKERSRRIVISSDSEEDEALAEYHKNLREKPTEPAKVERKLPERKKNFIVEDDYISESEEESDDSLEEDSDDDDDDDEYRESSPEVEVPVLQKKKSKRATDDEEWFLQSLTENFSGPIHEKAKVYVKENSLRQKKNRESLLTTLQEILVRRIFSEIPSEKLKVIWNARLRKSAGQCRNHRNGDSTVEMSPVVCTTAERLRDTLIHELCHAAVWVVDKLHKEGHGPGWKRWGSRCSLTFRSLPFVERCHSYEIEAKFFYICEKDDCGQTIKRQSKSLDTNRKVCGKCHGRFLLFRHCRRTNTRIRIEDPAAAKASAPVVLVETTTKVRSFVNERDEEFKQYSKEHYWTFTAQGMSHKEVMKRLQDDFKAMKS